MLVFSAIIATMIAFLRHDDMKKIKKEGLKLFLYMTLGIIAGSWIINFL